MTEDLIHNFRPPINTSKKDQMDLLIKNSDDIGAIGKDVYYGSGRVNANRAVTAAKNFLVVPVKKRR